MMNCKTFRLTKKDGVLTFENEDHPDITLFGGKIPDGEYFIFCKNIKEEYNWTHDYWLPLKYWKTDEETHVYGPFIFF